MSSGKTCFVICPIGEEGTETRIWSNLTFNHIIKPVVGKFEYNSKRANEIKKSGMITSQIIDQLLESDLVIADLTDGNPNVYYELAIRHFVKKPCIQMIKEGQKIPFDISGMRTIFFNIDLESAVAAKKELCEHIQSIEHEEFIATNPITLAHNQSIIRKALQDNKQELKDDGLSKAVIEAISNMTNSILEIKSDVSLLKNSKAYSKNEIGASEKEEILSLLKKKNKLQETRDDKMKIYCLLENKIKNIQEGAKKNNGIISGEDKNNIKTMSKQKSEINMEIIGLEREITKINLDLELH